MLEIVAKHDAIDPGPPAEHRFLEQLSRHPADAETRMVYADWLEETGQVRKSEVLRMFEDPNRAYSRAMRKASRAVDTDWLATVSRAPIEQCGVQFKLRCPKSWASLTPSGDVRIRYCDTCQRNVYFCATLLEVTERGRASQCVAFSPTLVREDALHAYRAEEMEMGEVHVPDAPRPPVGGRTR
jgi:uncharacterized protein (TIGR02996 family)